MTHKVGIYLRISDDREGRELGVERQEADCRALAARLGREVYDIYKDNDISASTRSRKPRPDYRRLLNDARSGVITEIIAYTSGRLTRRPRELEDQIELAQQQYGTQFTYVASPSFDLNTSAGRRIARTLAAQDAGEAEDIGERVARQKQQAREQGLWTGGRRRFGFEPDGMTLRPAEADAIRDAARRNLAGESARAVFRKWNTEGLYTTTGRPWDGSKYVQMMLRPCNTAKVGKLPRGTTKIREIIDKLPDAQWEKILDRETYLALAYKLTDPDRRTNYGTSQVLVGAGLYQCACGLTMRSGGLTSHGKPRYQCGNVHGRTAEKVDRYVLAVTEGVLTREGADLLPPAPDLTPLYERRAALRGRSEEIAADYADLSSGMTRDQFKIANAKVQREIAAVEAEIERHTGGSALTGVADAPDPVATFRSATIERQRAVIGALIAVTLHRTGRGRRRFDPESVQIEPKQ